MQHLKIRVPVKRRPARRRRDVPRRSRRVLETERQPYQAHFNMYRHPRIQPAIYSVSIIGPYDAEGPGRHAEPPADLRGPPASPGEEERAAAQILSTLMRRAYRRP